MIKIKRKAAGVALGLISSAAFGTIPLFSLPLLSMGVTVQSALFYRFFIAALAIWLILLAAREPVLISPGKILRIAFLSVLYMMAVAVFFYAFRFLPSGAVASIQFLYPVMVMLIMIFFFKEKFYPRTAWSVVLAVAGVAVISTGPGLEAPGATGPGGLSAIVWGVCLSLLSGLCNGLYFVGIQTVRIPSVNGLLMTFYVTLFGAVFCGAAGLATNSLAFLSSLEEFGLVFLLAIVTAVISNLTLILAIKRIGSTLSSILGVMEPLTAVIIGILVFQEPATWHIAAGVILIASSVFLAIGGPAAAKSA